jgi:hypothetical protein
MRQLHGYREFGQRAGTTAWASLRRIDCAGPVSAQGQIDDYGIRTEMRRKIARRVGEVCSWSTL